MHQFGRALSPLGKTVSYQNYPENIEYLIDPKLNRTADLGDSGEWCGGPGNGLVRMNIILKV